VGTLHNLARHWNTVRETDDPKTSPAVTTLGELLLAGRQARMNVLLADHLNRPLGPEARENVSTLVLGRVTTGTWKRLAPHLGTVPKGKTHPGRVHVVQGTTAHPTQVLFMSDAEAAAGAAGTAGEQN
jgi:hypothetical protein